MNNIGIIGYGSFGKFIEEIIITNFNNINIYIYNKNIYKKKHQKKTFFTNNINDLIINCNILFLSIPISSFEKVFLNIKDKINKNTIIIDVCTVKNIHLTF